MSELYFPSLSGNAASGNGPLNASELQGALCGLLCLDSQANRATWYKMLYEEASPDDSELSDLTDLFDHTIQSLNSLDFDLTLALPQDNAPLASRVLALADWCQGLIFGLGTSGLTDESELSADCKEFIADAINISRINADEIEETDTDEANFEELVEYLRMGVFLLYSELQPESGSQQGAEH